MVSSYLTLTSAPDVCYTRCLLCALPATEEWHAFATLADAVACECIPSKEGKRRVQGVGCRGVG